MKVARQGDIGFAFGEYTDTEGEYWDGTIPDEAEEKDDGVIAEGEISGHTHRIGDRSKSVLFVMGVMAYIKALREFEVDHDEHDELCFPKEDAKIVRQREYRPDGWVQVKD